MKRRAALLLLLPALALALAWAQTGRADQQVLFVRGAAVTVPAGDAARLELRFRILPTFHINSNQPGSDLLIPTVLRLENVPGLSVEDVKYPQSKELVFDFAPDEPLSVYDGDITLTATLKAAPSAALGSRKLRGMLSYQACNDRACFPPRKLPVELQVRVVKKSS